jgi:hypothetical protein
MSEADTRLTIFTGTSSNSKTSKTMVSVVTTIAALTLSLVIQPANASLALSTSSGNTSNFRSSATSPPPLRQGAGDWNTRKATTNNALLPQLSLSKSTTSSIMMSTSQTMQHHHHHPMIIVYILSQQSLARLPH